MAWCLCVRVIFQFRQCFVENLWGQFSLDQPNLYCYQSNQFMFSRCWSCFFFFYIRRLESCVDVDVANNKWKFRRLNSICTDICNKFEFNSQLCTSLFPLTSSLYYPVNLSLFCARLSSITSNVRLGLSQQILHPNAVLFCFNLHK